MGENAAEVLRGLARKMADDVGIEVDKAAFDSLVAECQRQAVVDYIAIAWQPIETAPRNGSRILLWDANAKIKHVKLGYHYVYLNRWSAETKHWKPTHWRMVPSPPPHTP